MGEQVIVSPTYGEKLKWGFESPTAPKKIKKGIDKPKGLWYNKNVKRARV